MTGLCSGDGSFVHFCRFSFEGEMVYCLRKNKSDCVIAETHHWADLWWLNILSSSDVILPAFWFVDKYLATGFCLTQFRLPKLAIFKQDINSQISIE